MKKTYKFLLLSASVGALLWGCKIEVLESPVGLTPDKTITPAGALNSASGALKNGLDAMQQINWCSSLIGGEELTSSISTGGSFLFANLIETEKKVQAVNSQNVTNARLAYSALEMANNGRAAAESITNAPAKALFLANFAMIEGIVYGTWSKFYESVPMYNENRDMTPDEGRALAIQKLNEAITQFGSYNNATITDVRIAGLFADAPTAIKFCNSYIATLLFDAGKKAEAGTYLSKGYVKADAGKELGWKNQNTLTGDGVYPVARNYVEFYVNTYAKALIDNRIAGDSLRRGTALVWWRSALDIPTLRLTMSYFYPQGPTAPNPTTAPTLATNPIVSWAEVALMQADPAVNQAVAKDVIRDVLTTWRMTTADINRALADPTVTLARVSRYEYMGRGRRYSAVGGFSRWELANEFKFK